MSYAMRNMKIFNRLLLVFLTLSAFSCKSPATEQSFFPEPIGIINDYSQIFTQSQRDELSQILYEYDIETTRQIVVVTVDSIAPYDDAQKYAFELGKEWRVGSAEEDNGLVVVLCVPIRTVGIATGYGTELVLTDEIFESVIDDIMIPEFRNEDYYDGIKKGVLELIALWE